MIVATSSLSLVYLCRKLDTVRNKLIWKKQYTKKSEVKGM